jgi:hypothetical protein
MFATRSHWPERFSARRMSAKIKKTMGVKSKTSLYALMISIMLLTPSINIPVPDVMKSLDIYFAGFFIGYILSNGTTRSLVDLAKWPIISLSALTALMVLLEAIYKQGDYTGISLSLRSISTILAALGSAMFMWKQWGVNSGSIFLRITIICAIIQGVVMWASFLFPEIRDSLSVIFYRENIVGREHLVQLRVPGFARTGGDGLSLNHGLLCIVGVMGTYLMFPAGFKRNLLLLVLFASNIGNAFTGRSGLYLATIFLVYLISADHAGRLRLRGLVTFAAIAVVSLVVVGEESDRIGAYGLSLREEYGYEYPIVRLLQGFITRTSEGTYYDDTISSLSGKMVFLPTDQMRAVIGNNNFGQMSSNYIDSDIGYIRMIHGFGVLGLFLFVVGVFLLPLRKITAATKTFNREVLVRAANQPDPRSIVRIAWVVLLYGMIAHWKIIFLSSRIFLFVVFSMLALASLKIRGFERDSKHLARMS